MKYKVVIEPEAQGQVRESYQYIKAESPLNAERWLQGLFKAIDSLENMPERCSEARENYRFSVHLCQLVYKSHRIIYTVAGDTVHVLNVRHGARRELEP